MDGRRSMSHAEAAVDGDDGTGDVGRIGRGEEGDDAGDLVGSAIRPSGTAAVSSAIRFSPSAAVMSVSTGPGATTLTVMPREPELAGERAGEADQAGLRRRVVGLTGRAEQADDRRHEDDPALAGAEHALRGALGDPVGGGEVGVDHAR